jgi:hypothetical protein
MPHVDKSFDYPNQLCLKPNCGSVSTRYEAKEVKKDGDDLTGCSIYKAYRVRATFL